MIRNIDPRVLEREQQRILRTKTPGRLASALTDNAKALRGKPLVESQTQPDFSDPAALDTLLANLKMAQDEGERPANALHALDPDRVASLLDLK